MTTGWEGLHHPPAGRSCRLSRTRAGSGGDWADIDSTFGMGIEDDFTAIETSLPEDEWLLLMAELEELMDQGALGLLSYQGRRTADVSHVALMQSSDGRILELRLTARVDGAERRLQTRAYFTEPANHHRELLLVHVAAKRPDHLWKDEQNAHVRNAVQRLAHRV